MQALSKKSICRVGVALTSLGDSPHSLGFIHMPSSQLCISNLLSDLDSPEKEGRLARAHHLLSANTAFAGL